MQSNPIYSCAALYDIVLYRTALYYTVLYYTVLQGTMDYGSDTSLSQSVTNHSTGSVLFRSTVLYCIVL